MKIKSRGEIGTTLTLITLGFMVAGAIAGSRLSQTGPRLESKAITPPSDSCAGNSCIIPGSFCTTCLNPKEQQSCPAGFGVTKVYTCKNFKWQDPHDYLECQAPCAPPASTPQPTSPPGQPTSPPAICGDACTLCILNNRPDILPFYGNKGWDVSCNNHNAIVSDWCRIDDPGCRQIQNTTCSSACAAVVSCTGFNFFDAPANNATLVAGNTYHLKGWARACTSPSGQGFRHALDLHLCQGSSCSYIGAASASDRPDTVSYCGTTQPNQNGWYFDWVIPSTLAGTYTIKAANIATDQKDASGNFKCINWSEKTISILPATPTPTSICLIPEGCISPAPTIIPTTEAPKPTPERPRADVPFEENFEATLNQWEVTQAGSAVISTDKPHAGSKGLRVNHGGGGGASFASHRFTSPTAARVAVWIYDNLSNPDSYIFLSLTDDAYTKGVSIGIYPNISKANYVYCPTENLRGCMDTGTARTAGWHQFKIFATPKGTYGKIDATSFSYLPANETNGAVNVDFTKFQRLNLGILGAASTTAYFDDVYVDTFPLPPSDEQSAQNFINIYLASYENINIQSINNMIKARESQFCTSSIEPCPDGSGKPPHWHYLEQLFHVYNSLLNTAGAHSMRYLKEGRTSDLNKSIEIIRYINGEHDRWKQSKTGSFTGTLLALNSWFIWNHLDSNLQQSIRSKAVAEAEYFKNTYQPYSEYVGNSSGEENSWPAIHLSYYAIIFPSQPEMPGWLNRVKYFAFHSLTKNESFGGFTSRTIYDDFMFDNHDYHPHPGYGSYTAGTLTGLAYLQRKFLGTYPTELDHYALSVWQKMQQYIDFRNFQYKGHKITRRGRDINGDGQSDYTPVGNAFVPSGKDDWGGDALWPVHYRLMKEMRNYNTYTDPETGFTTSDLARHASEYIHYIKNSYLWRWEKPNVQFTEMLIDHGFAHYFPGWQEVESYRWYQNSGQVWAFVAYLFYFDPSVSLPSTASDKIGTLIPPIDPSICEGEGGKCIARAQCLASDPNAIVEAFRGCPIEQVCCKSSSKAGGEKIVTGSTNPDFAQAIDCFSKELCNPLQISLFINQLNRWAGLQIQPCEVPCEFNK